MSNMLSAAAYFSKSFAKAIEEIISVVQRETNDNWKDIRSTIGDEMKVGTMTLYLRRSDKTLDGVLDEYIKLPELSSRAQGGELMLSFKKTFSNSVMFSLLSNGKTKSIKVFINGTLQLGGIQSGRNVSDILLTTMQAIGLDKKASVESMKLKNFNELAAMSIAMMNWFCHVGFRINLKALDKLLQDHYGNGLNRMDKEKKQQHTFVLRKEFVKKLLDFNVSISVYTTGKIMLSGDNKEDIISAHSFIINYIVNNRSSVEDIKNIDCVVSGDSPRVSREELINFWGMPKKIGINNGLDKPLGIVKKRAKRAKKVDMFDHEMSKKDAMELLGL